MFSKKITELTKFHPGLIYHFVAEGENQKQSSKTPWQDYYVPSFLQFNDILETYLHLQNRILPMIESKGLANVTPEEWMQIIKDIHLNVSKQLGKAQSFTPGTFRTRSLIIAKDDMESLTAITYFIAGYLEMSKSNFCKTMAKDFHRNPKDYTDVIDLMIKMSEETHIELAPSQVEFLSHAPRRDYSALLMRERLTTAYLNNQLSEQEKNIVDKLMKPCPHPEQLEALFSEFTSELSQQLQSLNVEDDADIAKFLANCFWKITGIHPFANANGRTALCFMNLILRAIGKPNICLYRGLDKNDIHSDYYQSIALIENERLPLQNLIIKRMHEDIIIDDQEMDKTNTYVDFCQTLSQRNEQMPRLSVDQIYNLEINKICPRTPERPLSPQETLDLFKAIMRGTHPSELHPHSIFAISKKDAIEYALKRLTPENTQWKYYEKANCALLECTSSEEARNIRDVLQKNYDLNCTVSRIAVTAINVVQIKDIQLETLKSKATKEIVAHPSI